MVVVGRVRKGAYFDSVTLMTVARELSSLDGVDDAAVVMGTAENRAILEASDLLVPEFEGAGDTDLLIGVRAENGEVAERAFAAIDGLLESARSRVDDGGEIEPRSLDGALDILPDANLALVSVAGRYAGDVAAAALDRGMHVMLFSDNVPVQTEIDLKRRAHARGLLVMGPDCGTAIVNGVPLGFANAVSRGPVGIVAAAGTGLQEVSTLVSNLGSGISQALGTGGRDVTKDVGGVSFLDAIEALAGDDATEVIVLVSKPPDPDVRARIAAAVEGLPKPVVSVFLGAAPEGPNDVRTLADAAVRAATLALGRAPEGAAALEGGPDTETVERLVSGIGPGRRFVRALLSGGTFAAEAQVVLADLGIDGVHSNAPLGGAEALDDPLRSAGHTVVDLGADEFTVGRPHPMIDYSIRTKRIVDEAADAETAVVLLDVVLGYGSNLDPAAELAEPIAEAARNVAVVCSVTGTDGDPQNRTAVREALERAGAHVAPSFASAARIAGAIVRTPGAE